MLWSSLVSILAMLPQRASILTYSSVFLDHHTVGEALRLGRRADAVVPWERFRRPSRRHPQQVSALRTMRSLCKAHAEATALWKRYSLSSC